MVVEDWEGPLRTLSQTQNILPPPDEEFLLRQTLYVQLASFSSEKFSTADSLCTCTAQSNYIIYRWLPVPQIVIFNSLKDMVKHGLGLAQIGSAVPI